MPTPRKYANHAERQAAYRRRLAEATGQQAARAISPPPIQTNTPSHSRWHGLIRRAKLLLETVQEEMEEHYEQRSDRWQESERGEGFLERLQSVQEALASIEELCS